MKNIVLPLLLLVLSSVQIVHADFTTQIKNQKTNECIEVLNAGTGDNVNVTTAPCVDNRPHQTLNFKTIAGETNIYKIEFAHSGKCLDVAGGSDADGTNVQQMTCQDIDGQRFRLETFGEEYSLFTYTGPANNVVDMGNDFNVQTWLDWKAPNQRWSQYVPAVVTGPTELVAEVTWLTESTGVNSKDEAVFTISAMDTGDGRVEVTVTVDIVGGPTDNDWTVKPWVQLGTVKQLLYDGTVGGRGATQTIPYTNTLSFAWSGEAAELSVGYEDYIDTSWTTETGNGAESYVVGVIGEGEVVVADFDGDGIPDSIDNCRAIPNPDQLNTDGDTLGNVCDDDDDNDGISDQYDADPLNPAPDVSSTSEVVLTWTAPTERENGDALALEELVEYNIRYQCNNRAEQSVKISLPPYINEYVFTKIWGDCTFAVNTMDENGLISQWSDSVRALIKLDKPQRGGIR